MISAIETFAREHMFFVWFVIVPLLSTLVCMRIPGKFSWMPLIAIAASLLLEWFVNPFLFQDLFGAPADDFSFVSGYWLLTELFLFIPFTLVWMLCCRWIDRKLHADRQ